MNGYDGICPIGVDVLEVFSALSHLSIHHLGVTIQRVCDAGFGSCWVQKKSCKTTRIAHN